MGQALYRKYRSKSFDDVIGQNQVTKTLKNAIKSGRISHAYLFTGPRGVGKTSVARILAHEVNQLPYNEENIHLDIIEIDGASNRRIDEIRDLREKVHIAPTSAKYKVYIIDEVHMLTREAFNALLKTLEEPPTHCIFIMATTEVHKLPETIISRTQRFNFKPVGKEAVIEHFENIARQEKIDIEEEALNLIVEHGEGSIRDSLSLLDQLSASGNKITAEIVRQALGLPPAEAIVQLDSSVTSGDIVEVLKTLEQLKNNGVNPERIANSLSEKLRNDIMHGSNKKHTIELLRQLLKVGASARPQDYLEIALLEAASQNKGTVLTVKIEEEVKKPPKASSPKEISDSPVHTKRPNTKKEMPATTENNVVAELKNFDMECWPEIIDKVKSEAASLYTALRLASPTISENGLILAFQFPLHQKKVNQAKNLNIIGKTIEDITGLKVKISCTVNKSLPAQQPNADIMAAVSAEVADRDESLQAINNIFGSAEVLET